MRDKTPLAVLWRRKWILLATVLAFAVGTAVVSKTLEEVYSTDATLLIALRVKNQSFDAVQASQSVARSYADIIESRNVADLVADDLGDGTTSGELLASTSFEPAPETQLLTITAESTHPQRAKLIADSYAQTFIEYAEQEELDQTTGTNATLADAAPLPVEADRPKPVLYTLVGTIIGLALGIALALLREQLDTRLRTAEDVERELDLPILANIPQRGRSQSSASAFQEAYRVLRTNLQFMAADTQMRAVGIVSAEEGEGKTTTAAQLALATASAGLRVVVLEADLRRPTLHKALMPEQEAPPAIGLSNYLVGAASIDEAIEATSMSNLDYVPAGPLPPSSSALLDTRRASTVVADLLERFDHVVVDSPPVGVAADAAMISRWVDGVVMVIDMRKATTRAVHEAIRQLRAVDTTIAGVVLNRDRRAGKDYNYYGDGKATDGRSRIEDVTPSLARR